MTRFTFAAGNLRKIAAAPLYGLGMLAGHIVRRSDDLWVVGSGIGVGEGALALARHARAADPRLRLVWLARGPADLAAARAAGFPAARKDSWRGFRLTLRARAAIVTHGFGDVNRYALSGAFVVQLWHGVPFKRLRLDSPAALHVPVLGRLPGVPRAIRWAYARAGRQVGMATAASAAAAQRLKSAFGLRDAQFAVTGDPRDDAVFAAPQAVRDTLAELLHDGRAGHARTILYAPTWRDGADDPAVPDGRQWRVITGMLERTGSILLVRSHPLGAGDYTPGADVPGADRVRALPADRVADITPLLPAVDVLVTDYSSIAFDFALLGRPIVFFAPDVADYARRHGTYEPYEAFAGADPAASWEEAAARLGALTAGSPAWRQAAEHATALAARFHTWQDGSNTARAYRELRRRLRGQAPHHTLGEAARQGNAVRVDALRITDDGTQLVVAGPVDPSGAADFDEVRLAGPRAERRARPVVAGSRWQARLPLLASRWAGAALPPPSGAYRLVCTAAGATRACTVAPAAGLAPQTFPGLFRVEWDGRAGELSFEPPLRDEERGPRNQARLQHAYRRARVLEDAVFFESFYGRNASCNPRGIDRALAAIRPQTTRYWSVADASVPVPDGATPVVEGTQRWWQARARSRVLVVNDWLRKRYRRRPGQSVLQTWHGTPLKRIALLKRDIGLHARVAVGREQARWDVMLAQNPFSAEIFRAAYGFRRQIWQEGYPRNDVLAGGDGAAVRARLGIPEGARVVLYAPTWRDDRPGRVDHLHAAEFTRLLGEGHLTLVRGHSRTLGPGRAVSGPGVLDVTDYPDTSDLLLAADVVVTDYSSIMFDATVTGKPIFFFVPDLDSYRDRLRGFTFDLLPAAPGPVLHSRAELADAVRHAGDLAAEFADRYRRWRARFDPRDDGHAGERVVHRMIRSGML